MGQVMLQPLNYHAQLADLGVSLACNFANMAMSCAAAATVAAFAVPLALAASAQASSHMGAARFSPASEPAAGMEPEAPSPYAAFRSGGGHASTAVVIGTGLPR